MKINSYFLPDAYPPEVCESYCQRMASDGVAQDGLNCNIIMWWGLWDQLKYDIGAWVHAHDKHRLCYGISSGPYEPGNTGQIQANAESLKRSGYLTDNIYLDHERGIADFSSLAYTVAIQIFDPILHPLRYFISPYTNQLGVAAVKRLHKQALEISKVTDALIVIAPQDGVGACKYPGSPVSSFSRYPGKAGFIKVQNFFAGLSKLNAGKVIYRTNLETFQWKGKPAEPSRLQAQIDKMGRYSYGGIGPCWCWF